MMDSHIALDANIILLHNNAMHKTKRMSIFFHFSSTHNCFTQIKIKIESH